MSNTLHIENYFVSFIVNAYKIGVIVLSKSVIMRLYVLFLIMFAIILSSCRDQEAILTDRYLNLEEPHYYGDSDRMQKIQKIHSKLYKKQSNNLIYFGNLFQMNCLLGNYEENIELIETKEFEANTGLNPIVYKNFYLALNSYREDPNSDYEKYLRKLNNEDLIHNPLLGYIAARCTDQEVQAYAYYPLMLEFIRYMPERNTIVRMIESDNCERFLELYRGICPICEVCKTNYEM